MAVNAALPCLLSLSELMFLETSALTGENVEEAFVQCARKILNKIESGRGAGGERARRGPPAPCVASRCFGAAGQRAWSPLTRQPTTATWGSAPLPLAPGPPTGTRLDLCPRSQPLLGQPCVLARGGGYSVCPWLLRTRLCEAKGPRLHVAVSRPCCLRESTFKTTAVRAADGTLHSCH